MMYTKFCILFVCSLAVASTARITSKGMIQNAVDVCAVRLGYRADKYVNFISHHMNIKLNNCVAACAMKILGTISKDGVFTGEEAKFLMAKSEMPEDHDEKINDAIEICAKLYGRGNEKSCKTVKKLQMCYKTFLRNIMHSEWNINGLVNQVLLLTFEDYADAYPVEEISIKLMNDTKAPMNYLSKAM